MFSKKPDPNREEKLKQLKNIDAEYKQCKSEYESLWPHPAFPAKTLKQKLFNASCNELKKQRDELHKVLFRGKKS